MNNVAFEQQVGLKVLLVACFYARIITPNFS